MSTVDVALLIAALKTQRNVALDEAAMLKAAFDGAQACIAELEAAAKKPRK